MRRLAALGVVLFWAAGCTGAIPAGAGATDGAAPGGGPARPGTPTGAVDPVPTRPVEVAPPASSACSRQGAALGVSPVRRLTRTQYRNTVKQLLGLTDDVAAEFVVDAKLAGFTNNATTSANDLIADQYRDAAERAAAAAVKRLDTLLGCSSGQAEAACVRAFVERFGKRAFRRPLTAAESAAYQALYDGERKAGAPHAEAVSGVVEALLQSPQFLYHLERGVGPAQDGLRALDHHEIASRLSFFFWDSMPDDALLAAADAGKLGTAAGVAAEARRLLDDPKARTGVAHLLEQWMELDRAADIAKDPQVFPQFTASVGAAARDALKMYLADFFWSAGARFDTLLTDRNAFANEPLARIYGVQGVTGATLKKVALDPAQRAGLLTQVGFLASHAHGAVTSPVHRGLFVRSQLLCQETPPPPPQVDVTPPPDDPGRTRRQLLQQHLSEDYCASCHALIDPLGFAFEHYDAIGAYRTVDNGKPVDATGTAVASDIAGTFTGAPDLLRRLAGSAQARRCAIEKVFTFALARRPGDASSPDGCAMKDLETLFASSDLSIKELLVHVASSAAFRFRAAGAGEVCR